MRKKLTNFMLTCCTMFLAFVGLNSQAQVTKTFVSNGTWQVPDNVYSVQIECWGAGGAGGYTYATLTIQPAGGGGGGAYAKSSFNVTPGSTLNITVGKGGTATGSGTNPTIVDGGNTMVVLNGETKVLAAGGKTPTGYNNRTGSAGGSISDCIFTDVAYAGGNGGNANYGAAGAWCASGGGGGAAGTTNNGGNGGNGSMGSAGAAGSAGAGNPSSGKGGAGRASKIIGSWSGAGYAGSAYGGGGGGSIAQATGTHNNTGGAGADGYVLITYFVCNVTPGTIAQDNWVCLAEDTTVILNSVTPASHAGGNYVWETSTDGTSWSAIASANAEQYTVANTTGMFRRSYIAEHCPTLYSNTVTVTRPSDINPGTIVVEGTDELTFNVCKGSDFSKNLTTSTSYDVTWQTSNDQINWSDVTSVSPLTLENVTGDVYVRYLANYTSTCQVPSNNVITIKTLNRPVVNSFTNPTELCPETTSFTVSANVSENSTITTYTWTNVDANTDGTATINATAPACNHTYEYSLVVTDEFGCESAVKTGSFTTMNPTEITVEDGLTADAVPVSSCMCAIPELTDLVTNAVTSSCSVTVVSQTPATDTQVPAGTTTDVVVTVEDACGNTLDVTVTVTAPMAYILRDDAIVEFNAPTVNVILWYGACDTLVNIEMPTYTINAGGFEGEIVLSNNRSAANEGAILGRVAPGTHTIVWRLTDPCGNYVEFTQDVIVVYPDCGEGVTVTDADGNTYETVRIDCECWTKSNLRSESYSDGSAIAFTRPYTFVEVSDVDEEMFGRLYTWYSAMHVDEGDNTVAPTILHATGSNYAYIQGVCPEGWAIPETSAYQQIATDANALKSTDADAWLPGSTATNSLGFTATGAGYYEASSGRYFNLLGETYFWTAETSSMVYGTCCVLTQNCPQGIITDKLKGQGFSVRCVKREN